MGLIKFFKKMFEKKVIQMKHSKQSILIQELSPNLTIIKLGQKICVEKGYCAVIVAKDRVLDVFTEGTHEISIAYIPKTTKLLKLDRGKVVKRGMVAEMVMPSRFKCDLYYVRVDEILTRKWKSGKVNVREKGKQNFKYSMEGEYSFQATDPAKVVELFLIDWARIISGKELEKLDMLVSEAITETLWNKKINSKEKLIEYEFGNNVLKPSIFKAFNKYGICINDIKVENIIYPESLKTKTYQSIEAEKVEDVKNATPNQIENNEELIEYATKVINQEETKQNKIPYKSFDDNLKCSNCGARLSRDSLYCDSCGLKVRES